MSGGIEAVAEQDPDKQIVLGVWAISGVLMLLAFFLPSSIGTALTGRGVITVAITFIGSGLIYLAMLPIHSGNRPGA
ncbi:hypothetical protein VB773_02575 [Haloarculaceae archaeon H-GB2-1]|nr:hypothetical protein [Haloarculaceae archaeon H-GB1-1]MEA5406573.1 hypothetical protein [Haloarculaceae archaeon H-GB2-1]